MTYVGSATETRSRRDDESIRRHRRGGATKRRTRPAPTLWADGGCGRSLCRSSSTMPLHRLLLSSRPLLVSPIRIRYRIYEREYSGSLETGRNSRLELEASNARGTLCSLQDLCGNDLSDSFCLPFDLSLGKSQLLKNFVSGSFSLAFRLGSGLRDPALAFLQHLVTE